MVAIEQLLTGQPVKVIYTNWQGKTAPRTILARKVWRGLTAYHPVEQILVTAVDVERDVERDFALKDMVLA